MAKYASTIEYNIKTNLDASGLQRLQAQLSTVTNNLQSKRVRGLVDKNEIDKEIAAVQKLQDILNKSFNAKLGTLNLSGLTNQLRASKTLVNELNRAFQQAGASGTAAANTLTARLFKMDTGLKSVSKTTDKIVNTIGNTFRWGVIASGFASIMNAVHDAAKYTSELDKSLTNIMMVTGESRENMNQFAKAANEAAQKMGSTTTAMTNATTIFVQQGLDLQTSEKLAEYSVHLANVSGQESAEAADEITAYKNAFKIDVADVENAISKWAAVANNAAVSVEELSTASQKAASVAQTVGVDMDQFAGHIAAIEATTREAPENIGNGLKTLYSRISDIKLGESLEDGVDLGQFTSALQKVGVEALDASGQLRDAGAIIEDLMARWGDLSRTEQVATATTVAGRFQLARFEALLNSADIYKQAKDVSVAETGTATYDRMQETFRDSMQGRMNALQASVEEVFNNLFTTDSMYPLIEGLNNLVDVFNDLIESVGGGSNALSAFGLIFGQIFNTQIARAVNNFQQNRELARNQESQYRAIAQLSQQTLKSNGVQVIPEQSKLLGDILAKAGVHAGSMSQEEFQAFSKNAQEFAGSMNVAIGALQKANETTASFVGTLEELGAIEAAEAYTMEEMMDASIKAKEGVQGLLQTFNQLTGAAGKDRGLAGLKTLTQVPWTTDPQKLRQQQWGITSEMFGRIRNLQDMQSTTGVQLISDQQIANIKRTLVEIDNADVKTEEFKKAVSKLAQQLSPLEQKLLSVSEAVNTYSTSIGKLAAEEGAANIQATQSRRFIEGEAERLSSQDRIQNITGLAMGIGQLAFAVESFANLPAIFSNEDLDIGEKLLQLITNLGFTIPMVTMGLSQFEAAIGGKGLITTITNMTKATDALKASKIAMTAADAGLIEAESVLTAVKEAEGVTDVQVALAEKDLLAATEAKTVADERAAIAAETHAKAVRALKMALGITAALLAAGVAVGMIIDHYRKLEQEYQENLKTSNEVVSAINSQKKSYDELYKTYKETGEATTDLEKSAVSLAEALGVQGAEALANAGKFKTLNDKIEKATEQQLRYNAALMEEERRRKAGKLGIERETEVEFGTGDGGMGHTVTSVDTRSNGQILGANAQKYNELQEEIKDYRLQLIQATDASEEWKQNIRDTINDLDRQAKKIKLTADQLEDMNNLQQEIDDNFQADLISGQFKDIVKTFGTDASKYKDYLLSAGGMQEYYDYLRAQDEENGTQTADAFVNGYLQALAEKYPEIADAIEKYITQQDLEETTKQFGKNLANQITAAFQSGLVVNEDGNQLYLEEGDAEEMVQDYINYINNSQLSDEDKIELLATISDKSWPEMNEAIHQAVEDGNLENIELAASAGDRAASSGPIDKDVDEDEYKELAKYIGENAKEMEGFSEELETNAKELAEVTEEMLRYDKALEKAEKNMEDWEKMLKSGAVQDHAKAAQELANVYNDLLDVGEGASVSSDFAEDINNLELLKAAMQGNIDAYDTLQRQAAEDIITHIATDDDAALAAFDNVWDKIHEIDGEYASVDIGAEIHDEAFIQACEDMVNAAGMTAEEATAALSEMGVDAEVEAETAETSDPITYTDLIPTLGAPTTATVKMPGSGEESQISVPSVIMKPVPHTVDSSKAMTGFALKTTANGKSSGGNLKINSARKGAGGAAKYANASHGAGASSGGSGKGGGGGSKGKEPSKISRTKEADTEKDIYNKLNAQLEKLQDNYKKIDRLKENAAGAKYRKYINEEIANLEAQNANLAKRNKLTKEYLKALKGNKDKPELNVKKTDTLGFYGLKDKNKDGVVDNYDSVINKARKEAAASQKAADDYFKAHGGTFDAYGNTVNQATMDENESKEYKRLTEKASDQAERVKSITDAANKYQDAWNDVRDTLDQIDENLQSIIDKQVELFDRAVDAAQSLQEVNESAAKLKAFGSKNGFGDWTSSDSPFRAMVEDGELLSGTYDKLIDDSDAFYDDMIKKAKKNKDAASQQFWEDQKKNAKDALGNGTSAIDLAQNQLEFLLSDAGKDKFSAKDEATGRKRFDEAGWLEAVKKQKTIVENAMYRGEELVEKLTDDIINGYKKIDEYMNDHFEKYQQWLDKLEYRNKLIELTYGESNLEAIGDNLEAQSLTLESLIKDENTYYEQLKVEEQKRWEDYKKNGTEKSYELWKEVHDLAEAQSDKIEDLVVQRIEAIQAIAKNNIEKAKRAMDQAFYGTAEDPFVQSWELAKERADAYKDEVEAGYEIDKLRGKFQKLLDNASTLKTQKQIKQVMQEQLDFLNAQVDAENHKVTMSQFDVDLANAKIALLEKQIALEDAQRNKNQMQLRRDSQGNYNYVYTANDDEVNEKEEEVLDAGYDIYEMSKQEVQRINEEAVRMYQDAQNRIAAIQESTVLDATQKKKMVAEILDNLQARFVEMGVDLQDAIQGTIDGASILYKYGADDTKSYYAEMATATKDTWNKAAKDVGICYSDTIHEVLAGNKEFNKSVETMRSTFNTEINNMKGAADTVTEKISKDFEETTESVDDTKEAVKSLTSEMDQLNQAMKDDLGAIDTASTRLQKYTKQLNTTKDSASKLRQDLNDANETIAKLKAENLDYSTRLKNLRAGRAETDNGDKPKGKGEENKSSGVDEATAYGIAQNIHTYGSWGNDPVRKKRIIERYGEATAKRAQEIVNEVYNRVGGSAYAYELYNPKSEIYGYDTGGYTGAWGSDGKLAVLHEKELVLNQQDTVNMLAAIDMVRQIIDAIKTPNFSSSLGNWTSSKSGDTIEQRVEVTAEFPNVTDSGEIEAALISLADNAYQYAHRN